MKTPKKLERTQRINDILHCQEQCQTNASEKILKLWSGEYIKDVERSMNVSTLQTQELNLLNRIFGSGATCHTIEDLDLQRAILTLIPHDLFRNFRRATYKKPVAVTVEDWLWIEDNGEFVDELDIELTVLESLLVSLMLFTLGGFTVPRDDMKKMLSPWMQVDVSSIFSRPRELFLMTEISPAVLSRYVYWKVTSVLMGLMRLFSKNVSSERVSGVKQQLIENGTIDAPTN